MKTRPAPARDDSLTAPLRLMVFCDRPSASQEIHLFRPLQRARAANQCALFVRSEDAVTRAGISAVAADLDRVRPHALVFSRFGDASALAILEAARARSIPCITHIDDFLLEVPPDVGAAKAAHHARPERLAALTATLREATLIYASTKALAQKLGATAFTAPIVTAELQSCADADELAAAPDDTGDIRIGYQGSSSHGPDLDMIAPALVQVLSKRPRARLTLFGTIKPPAALAELGGRVRHMPAAADYAEFLDRLRKCRWHIGLAPLRDTEFNSFRTYTKWTEYSIAGAAVLASDTEPFREIMTGNSGVLVQDDQWSGALLAAIDDAEARQAMVNAAQTKLRSELTLGRQELQVRAMLRRAGVRPA